MRRRLAVFLSTALAASTLMVFTAARPASAVDLCAFQGVATTSPTYYPPFTGPLVIGNARKAFAFAFTIGACVHLPSGTTGKTITATGTYSGWCGLSSGTGVTGNGALFAWVGVGEILILTGHLVGLAHATPDILNGQSCFPTGPGATSFLVTGAFALLNCHGVLGPDFSTLFSNPLGGGELFHVFFNGPCVPDVLNLD